MRYRPFAGPPDQPLGEQDELARLIRTLTGDDYARTLGRKLTRRRICSITRHRKGGRTYLVHKDGDCVLLDWHAAKR